MSIDKPLNAKERFQATKWIFSLLFKYKLILVFVVISLILSLGLRSLIPVLIGVLIDDTILNSNPDLFVYLIALILIIGLIRVAFNFVMTISFSLLHWKVVKDIREIFFGSIQKKPMKFHDKTRSGDLMALATYDVSMFSEMIDPGLRILSDVIITFSFFILFGMLQNPTLALLLTPFMLLYILSIRSYNNKMRPLSEFFERKWSLMSITAQDNITGVRVVRAFGGEEYEKERFRKVVEDFRDLWRERQIVQAKFWPLLMIHVLLGASLFIGVYMINLEMLTLGELIAFNGLIILLIQPTNMISWSITVFQSGLAGGGRIYRLMEMEEDETEEGLEYFDWSNLKGDIEFQNVTFNYPDTAKPSLKNINLKINSGETVAIVGASGSGKTTLTKLVIRLYDYQGKILLDGIDLQNLKLDQLRQNIGRVEQDVFLFATSIKNNITFGIENSENISDKDLENIAKMAQAHNFIMDLEKGYDTKVGERGVGLSGGQKQRIAIARCFFINPKILILDDTTSSIDSKTEEEIAKAMNNVIKDRTTFLITHRISAIRKADKIVFLKNGEILGHGTHNELIKSLKEYRRIFDVKRKYLTQEQNKLPIKGTITPTIGGED